MNHLISLLKENEFKFVTTSSFEKDEIIFNENATCNTLGLILEGAVSIISYSYEGKNIVFKNLKKGDGFGENLVFSSEPFYKGNVISTSNTTIAFIKKEDLISILQENKNFLIEFLNVTSEFTKELNSKIKILSFDTTFERFTYFMHTHKNSYNMKSIKNLADELGVSRETLSRLLAKLQDEEKIIIFNNKITLID